MHLHVLAGCRELLTPAPLFGDQLVPLLGDRVRIATAFWLSRRCGRFYHDFLLEAAEDMRVEVFAFSLRENFGHRFEPLVILPTVIAEATAGAAPEQGYRGAPGVLQEIWRQRPAQRLVLHALALPPGIDADGSWAGRAEMLAPWVAGRLDGLRASLGAAGFDIARIETRVTEVPRNAPQFEPLLRNALSCQVAERLGPVLAGAGLGADGPRLEAAIAGLLEGWSARGILPARSLGAGDLDRLSDRIAATLLANPPADAHA